jgi:hypothetical protein
MHNKVNLTGMLCSALWWHGRLISTITPEVLHRGRAATLAQSPFLHGRATWCPVEVFSLERVTPRSPSPAHSTTVSPNPTPDFGLWNPRAVQFVVCDAPYFCSKGFPCISFSVLHLRKEQMDAAQWTKGFGYSPMWELGRDIGELCRQVLLFLMQLQYYQIFDLSMRIGCSFLL